MEKTLSSIGNYKITPTSLGEGSFSKVVLADHVILKKQVALKVVTLSKIKDRYIWKNLKREPAIMAKLDHPNIVALHEVVSAGDFYCLVLDFYPGGNLCDMIGNQDNHKLSEELSRAFFRQIISGIGHLHNKKIIHRDIKLENIFLDKSQTKLAIGDFGLSSLWDPSAKLRTRCGSAEYAAPEIYDRQSVYTQAVDMWSVGVSLYAMLTGRLPFEVEEDCSRHKLLVALINEGFTGLLSAGLGAVSMEARQLLSRLLTARPELRLTAEAAATCAWSTRGGSLPPVDCSPFQARPADSQLAVAGLVRDRLHLRQAADTVLDYLLGPRGRLGKTAGCYSLLAADYPRPRAGGASLSTTVLRAGPSALDFAALGRGAEASPAPSFWDSTPGRKAKEALGRVKEPAREEKGDEARKQRRMEEKENLLAEPRVAAQGTGGRQGQGSSWRRSVAVAPRKPRLRRVEAPEAEGQGRGLAFRDPNIRH